MGADLFATKEGTFRMEIRRWSDSKVLGRIDLAGLEPYEGLAEDIYEQGDPSESEAGK